jgi:serine/threonine-protein kinase
MASRRAGRYVLYDAIASGGMASVHLGRVIGSAGFARVVAIKRLHPHLSGDPEFVEMFLDEARLASRIHHPNVVATLDVVTDDNELLLVMEHVLGESWWNVLRDARERRIFIPIDVVSSVIGNMLAGLHAAHEACSETGVPLEIVHRDISPQNVLVGADGISRVVDFGIAKAISRVHSTRDGELKGKLRYMSPERILRTTVDRRADVYAAGVVLWESLTGERLFTADDAAGTISAVLEGGTPLPSRFRPEVPRALDDLVLRSLARDAAQRPRSALDFTAALEQIVRPAPPRIVSEFLTHVVGSKLEDRRRVLAEVETMPSEPSVGAAAPVSSSRPLDRRALAAADTAVSAISLSPNLVDGGTTTATMTDANLPKKKSRRRGPLVIAILLSVAGISAAYVGVARRPARAPTPIPSTKSEEPAPPAAAAASEPTPSAHVPTMSAPVPTLSATASAPGASTARKAGTRRPPTSPLPRATGSAVPSAKPVDDCNPAYTLDANGVKRFKPGCI